MKNILGVLPVGVIILDERFQVMEVNANIERFFGISSKDMVGKDKRALIRERIASIFEDPEGFQKRIFDTYDANSYVQNFVTHVLPGTNRQERWLLHFSQPILSNQYAGGRLEIYTDVTEQVVAEEHINWLSSQIMQLQEKEKARIARDLHDELGQVIVAQKMILETVANSLKRRSGLVEEETQLQQVIKDLNRLSNEIHRISSDLMPSLLEPLGLQDTLVWLKDKTQELYGLRVNFKSMGLGKQRLPAYLEVVIFRIFQEGLNNIVRHANAENVDLKLIYSYPKIIISIQDDGKGFAQKGPHSGLGLRFMRQRVSEVGGAVRIKSVPGLGTCVRVEIPYFKNRHDEQK